MFGFVIQKYQLYQAAVLLANGKNVYGRISSGQGKTIIILLCMLYIRHKIDNTATVYVVTSQLHL